MNLLKVHMNLVEGHSIFLTLTNPEVFYLQSPKLKMKIFSGQKKFRNSDNIRCDITTE